jgi:hypothetical protein
MPCRLVTIYRFEGTGQAVVWTHLNTKELNVHLNRCENPNSRKGVSVNLMFVDPCIIVRFIKKNPTRRNNVSKFYYSILI